MQSLEQFLSSIQTNSDFLNFFGILLTALVSVYIFKKESSNTFTRERHDKLIFPLFNLLEPVLYQDVPPDILKAALKVIEDNKNIADGKLLEVLYLCSKDPSKEHCRMLCSYANRMYDKSCWRLGLKLRSITYRINREQYSQKISLIFSIILYAVVSIGVGMLIFCAVLCGIAFLLSILYKLSDATNVFVATLISVVLGMIIAKYFDKHS